MVNLADQVMLTIAAKDNASNVAKNIDGSFQGMASNISKAMGSISSSMMNFSSVSDNALQSLTGKSALDNILGTSSKAETNKVLVKNMTQTEEAYESLYDTIDKTTDKSLTSMQELIPAMNAFKAATGASDKEMENITDGMANFGAAVLAQTGSTELAQGAMMDLSKGIKGAFASLDQYGVSEDALMRTNLWSGKEDDVEGYIAAVTEVIGSTDALMETNEGLDAQIGKTFSRAGKKLGNEFLPSIKDLKKAFIELDNETGGALAGSILATSGAIEVMNQGLWNVSTTVNGIKDLAEGFSAVKDAASGAASMIKNFGKASKTIEGVQIVGETTSIADDLFKVQEVSPEIAEAAAHAGAGFGYGAESTLEEIEKYAGNAKSTEKDAIKLLNEASEANEHVNAEKLKAISKWESMMEEAKTAAEGVDVVDDMGDLAKKTSKVSEGITDTVGAAEGIGAASAGAATASAEIEASSGIMAGLSASFTSMIVPLLSLAAVIAIMIPIAVALAAEALLGLKAIQMVFDALDFGDIDLSSSIKGIKQLAEGIAWVGLAMGALSFVNITTGLAAMTSGFLGITGPLTIAKDALSDAYKILQEFAVVKIDPSIPNNLKSIGESLKSVSDAMNAITNVTVATGFSNFIAWAFKLGSVSEALGQAKDDIIDASSKLNEFKDLTPLDKSVADNIQNVCDSLASVGNAMEALRSMRDGVNWDGFMGSIFKGVNIETALNSVKDDIIKASSALKGFTGLSDVPKDVGTKIQNVTNALKNVTDAFNSLRSIRDDVNWDGMMGGIFGGSDIASAITNVGNQIRQVSTRLASLSTIAWVDDSISEKINKLNTTLGNVSNAVTSMKSLPSMEGFDMGAVNAAVTNVRNVATQLSTLSNITLGGDSTTVLGTMQTALESLKATLSAASGFSAPATSIGTQIVTGVKSGLSPLSSTVTTAVSSATASAASAGWTGGAYIGTSTTNGFRSALNLHTVMSTEMGYVKTAVDNGISAAKTAAQNGAKEIVSAFQSGINVGSPGDIARTMSGEMNYTLEAIKNSYSNLRTASSAAARNIVSSFGNPSLNIGPNSSFTSGQIGSLQTLMSQVPNISSGGNVTIIIGERAVTVDARNKTEREAQQILITALESLDTITDIKVNGE